MCCPRGLPGAAGEQAWGQELAGGGPALGPARRAVFRERVQDRSGSSGERVDRPGRRAWERALRCQLDWPLAGKHHAQGKSAGLLRKGVWAVPFVKGSVP